SMSAPSEWAAAARRLAMPVLPPVREMCTVRPLAVQLCSLRTSRRPISSATWAGSSLTTTRLSVTHSVGVDILLPRDRRTEQLPALRDDSTIQQVGVHPPQLFGQALAQGPPGEGEVVAGLAGLAQHGGARLGAGEDDVAA